MTLRNRNRYTKLVDKIRRQYQTLRTDSTSLATGERYLIANASDTEWNDDNEPFSSYAPYNYAHIENNGAGNVRFYLNKSQDLYFEVDADSEYTFDDGYYFDYFSAENLSTTDSADIEVTFGRMVDSRELTILQMAGELNIQE